MTGETAPSLEWQPFLEGVRRFVASRVPGQDVDDVVQEVLLRIHRGVDAVRESGKVEPWLFSIARRTIADYYRARARQMAVEGADTSGDEPGAEPAVTKGFGQFEGVHSVHEEVLSWLRPLAATLPAAYREALLMADFDGRTQREVAEALGLSLSGAKSRVQRARRMLAERLEQCCEIELGRDDRVVDFRRRDDCDC